jgi:preprotein translocase subunit SecF
MVVLVRQELVDKEILVELVQVHQQMHQVVAEAVLVQLVEIGFPLPLLAVLAVLVLLLLLLEVQFITLAVVVQVFLDLLRVLGVLVVVELEATLMG